MDRTGLIDLRPVFVMMASFARGFVLVLESSISFSAKAVGGNEQQLS